MQWLIDLVIEAIGIPPTYIDRGDPATVDYAVGDFTTDATWRDLDISAIVPEGASAVHFQLVLEDGLVAQEFSLRKNGNVNSINTSRTFTQVANVRNPQDVICAVDATRIIEYIGSNIVFTRIDLTVRGWWL